MPEEVLQPPGTRAGPEFAEIARLTKVQKLAALLVMLGPDSAAAILKSFGPAEVETITGEMARLPMISQTLQQHLLAEFSDVALQASTSLAGGLNFARTTLEKALGVLRATEIINRVAPSRGSVAAIQGLADMEPRQIYNLLRHEQPQTVALFLSFVPQTRPPPSSPSSPDARERVLERLATLSPTPVEVVEKVVAVLNTRLGVRQTRALNQTGGIKTAADILNAMEKSSGKSLLLSIEEHNPELCQAIRQKMFTFEDLAGLEPQTLQRILREVDMRDLAMALKTASDKVKTALLACISKRAAETVQEEITYMGPLRLRDIENAQLRVIDAVRKLEADGDIELGHGRPNALHEVV
ncbi:MAG: flagellar motor switch protein FliG [Verrucomicrobia bacterium]|nr:flagellar motor switch protein FliG [Verrucomicrobiota bacterium]